MYSVAHHNFDGSFVTHFIFTTFLLLFTIPIWVQVVTICDRLHFYRRFRVLFKKLYRILQAVWGLYRFLSFLIETVRHQDALTKIYN